MASFTRLLFSGLPSLCRIDRSDSWETPAFSGEERFIIAESEADGSGRPTVTPDVATCHKCLEEIRDARERRFGYALTNCTDCGPRYSIIRDTPYDRAQTTMCRFGLCEKCHQQYQDARDRRYHAQPIACPDCGPVVEFLARLTDGKEEAAAANASLCQTAQWGVQRVQPIVRAAKALVKGRIVAIKGIGGYHLAVRADDEDAVAELRRRKHRDAKPFALMVADMAVAKQLVRLSSRAEKELLSAAAPIVLAQRLAGAKVAEGVGPGAHRLGVMLPYTPMQHLLVDALRAMGDAPPLVMTSANVSDEPLIKDDAEAERLLVELCDGILRHEREIERCVDDSVIIDMGEAAPLPLRRSRGYVPQPVRVASAEGPGLCLGGELKNTVAVVREEEVILSQHIGDLKHPLALANFKRTIADFTKLFKITPQWIAHDLHPSYLSTQYAKELARQYGVPTIAVQHHHAHAAAVLAEHGFAGEALAIVCDGVGYGEDGTVWGGELLRVNTRDGIFERLGHLPQFALPGGDAAARETRRAAAGLLQLIADAKVRERMMARLYPEAALREQIQQMLALRLNCPVSSAAGRWFDAVAAMLGVAERNRFEAEAPTRLEALAWECERSQKTGAGSQEDCGVAAFRDSLSSRTPKGALQRGHEGGSREAATPLERLPGLVQEIAAEALAGGDAGRLAARFHAGFADAWASAAAAAAGETGLSTVALSGGCFCNELLTRRVSNVLEASGCNVLRHELTPPNDGGVALGQAAVATAIAQQKGWR